MNKTVTDAVFDSAGEDAPCYTVTAYCTADNVQDFNLSPPRGTKCQYALIVVTDLIPSSEDAAPNLIVDCLMQLNRDDVPLIQKAMQKLLWYDAATSEVATRKRKREWSDTCSPAQASSCRSISRHPTGDEMPDYDRTPEKKV